MATMNVVKFLLTLGRASAQAGVLVLAVLLAQWVFRKQLAPRWRCALWWLVVIRLLLPVSFGSVASIFNLLPWFMPTSSPPSPPAVLARSSAAKMTEPLVLPVTRALVPYVMPQSIEKVASPEKAGKSMAPGTRASLNRPISWPVILFLCWLAGVAGLAIHVVMSSIGLARRFGKLPVLSNPQALAVLKECQGCMGVRTHLTVVEGANVASPALYGLFRPRLLLPEDFTKNFSARELRFVFLHELAHLKRRDLWLNWLFAVLQIIHWFNPLVWFGFVRWRSDRELACDALALESAGGKQNQEYGRTILRLVEHFTHRATVPALVGILEEKNQLKRRIQMIARFQPASRWSALGLVLIVFLAVGCLTDARSQRKVEPTGQTSSAVAPKDTGPMMLDLGSFQHRLETLAEETYMFNTITGRQTFDGLPFEIDGQAILFGQSYLNNRGADYPESLNGIRVGRKFDELHLIHYGAWLDADGTPLARLRLNYADGSKYEFAILYGAQVRDWFQQPTEEREQVSDPDTKICWRSTGINSPTGCLRLFKSMIRNPYPQKVVKTLDVISTRSLGSYVLVAATVAAYDPARPVTPPIPWIPPQTYDGAVVVHVLDQATGQPIEDATAITELGFDDIQNWAAPFHTSSNGTGIMRYPATKTKWLFISVHKQGYEDKTVRWPGERIPDQYTLPLTPASGRIGGVVLDEKGEPVANAGILVQNYNFNRSGGESISLGNVFTRADASGHWSIQGLPNGYQDFGVTVMHPDYPPARFLADGPVGRGIIGKHISTTDFFAGKAVLQIESGLQLTGTVRDTGGQPVNGARVFIGFDRYASDAVNSRTGTNGMFRFTTLKSGENCLTFSADGYAPDFRTVMVTATNAPLDVTLKPGRTIHGRVVDSAGKPIAGAEVSYDGLADRNGIFSGRTLDWKTETDTNGAFSWNSGPDQPILLTIMKGGYMGLEWTKVQTGTTNETAFTLGPPLTVKGLVTDADTGEPVAAFKITPGWPEGDGARFERQRASTGSAGHYEVHFESPIIISSSPFDFVFQISAPGYAPAKSRAIKPGEGEATWDVKLKRTPDLIGLVKTADGKPAAGVTVIPAGQRDYLQLNGTTIRNQNQDNDSYETASDGHFEMPPQDGDFTLIAASAAGFAMVSKADFTNTLTLTLQPWGRVEGVMLNNGRPMPNRELYFFAGDSTVQLNVWGQEPVATDAQGHFAFAQVPPGTVRLELKQPISEHSWSSLELQSEDVQPGGTNTVQINLSGRTVIGHLKHDATLAAYADWQQCSITLQPAVTSPPVPKEMDTHEKVQKWYQDWMKTDAGKKSAEAMKNRRQLQVKADGTFRAETVAPGKYTLSGTIWQNGAMQAQVDAKEVTVPEAAPNDPDAPFDIGEVTLKTVKHVNNGDVAPDFSVKTLDGQPLKLSDFRGKYVLLDFWATWCGPCVEETPNLKATYDAFGKDSRFVMVSLSLDPKVEAPQKFAQDKDIKWVQGFLGDWSKDNVTKDYAVYGIPSIFLIGPDGKIIAQNLRGNGIQDAVGSALSAR